MYNINSVVVEGTVDGDVKVIAEKDGEATIVQARVKHVKPIKDGKEIASWLTVKGYGKYAYLVEALQPEDHVVVYGQLKQERWKKGNQTMSSVVIEPYKILLAKCPTSATLSDNEDVADKTEPDNEDDLGF